LITDAINKIEEHINDTNKDKIKDFQLRENDFFKNMESPLNNLNKRISHSKSEDTDSEFKVIDGGKKAA
tara:strand:- start:1131 stop:1337 length:207 start_codon:yes stop_codon:yes gene_type:complete